MHPSLTSLDSIHQARLVNFSLSTTLSASQSKLIEQIWGLQSAVVINLGTKNVHSIELALKIHSSDVSSLMNSFTCRKIVE